MADQDDEFGGANPFGNIPLFGDLAKALAGQGPLNWDAARQFAQIASQGSAGASPANVDPAVRIALADLGRIAEMHVRDVTGLDPTFPEITPVAPGAWAQRTLEAYRPLFTELATSLGSRPTLPGAGEPGVELDTDDPLGSDQMMAMMANLSALMAPSMMGMAVGSMVGRMATRAFGQYDLPIPRADDSLLIVTANLDRFAEEWSVPLDQMRLWVLAHEMIGHSLFSITSLRDDYAGLVRRHVGAFRPDPSAVAERLTDVDLDGGDPMQAMQRLLSDPALLLGAVQSREQAALAPQLDAATAAIIGYVDYLVDAVAARVIGGEALRIAEAVRRRRVEASPDDMYIERLLGLKLTHEQVQHGKTFIGGVVDRVGESALAGLFARPGALPTPAELDAPGLWIARLEL